MYENGLAVDPDEHKAEELYLKAAMNGNGHAQCNLGWLWERRAELDEPDALRKACKPRKDIANVPNFFFSFSFFFNTIRPILFDGRAIG